MKRTILFLCLTFQWMFASAQYSLDTLFSRMEKQAELCPMEKVHLHTDRSTYVAGDTIWAKAYIVDGLTHMPARKSRYVYVTLQNPFGESVSAVCLRADEKGKVHGNLPLSDELPQGEYTLTAYTRYMENSESDYFFRKKITVKGLVGHTIRMESEIRGSHLDIRFRNPETNQILNTKDCAVYVPAGDIHVQKKDSGYSAKLHNPEEKVFLVKVGNYQEFVTVSPKPYYEVSFLPEGGNLIVGCTNRMAFKAINSLGQGENVRGTVRDEKDSILLTFESIHRGMGSFPFIPQPGRKYVAVCENSDGDVKRFNLPEATDGYSLQVNQAKEKYYVRILQSKDQSSDEVLYLLAHQKGWPIQAHQYAPEKDTYVFNMREFSQGTASFLLVSSKGSILNERMVFVHKGEEAQGRITSDKDEYGKRERMQLSVEVNTPDGEAWEGDCSVSVVNCNHVPMDSCSSILSSLLLESDLKGNIEEPSWYFRAGNGQFRQQALDALMMTQGWRRYNLEEAWTGAYRHPLIAHEMSQTIQGKVTRRVSRKPVEEATVQMMIPPLGVTRKVTTGKDGTFRFEGFEYPDSTVYWVNAYTHEGKDNIVLQLDTIVPPRFDLVLPSFRADRMLPVVTHSSEVMLRSVYQNGMRHIFLDEVSVTAPKKKPRTEYETVIGAKSIKEDRISQSGVNDLLTFLRQQYAAINWIEKDGFLLLTLRGAVVTVYLDGSIARAYDLGSHDVLRNFLLRDVAQIDIIPPPFSVCYDPLAGGGIVAITTKEGGYGAEWHPTNLKNVQLLGYQEPVEFYSPRYGSVQGLKASEPDHRTTVHWQPCLDIKNGKATVEFYTTDDAVNYSIVIEGVRADGTLLSIEKRMTASGAM